MTEWSACQWVWLLNKEGRPRPFWVSSLSQQVWVILHWEPGQKTCFHTWLYLLRKFISSQSRWWKAPRRVWNDIDSLCSAPTLEISVMSKGWTRVEPRWVIFWEMSKTKTPAYGWHTAASFESPVIMCWKIIFGFSLTLFTHKPWLWVHGDYL